MRIIKSALLLSLITMMTACSGFYSNRFVSNRDSAYLNAKSIPPLSIPAGVDSSKIHEEYPVSDHTYANSDKKVNLTPPGL